MKKAHFIIIVLGSAILYAIINYCSNSDKSNQIIEYVTEHEKAELGLKWERKHSGMLNILILTTTDYKFPPNPYFTKEPMYKLTTYYKGREIVEYGNEVRIKQLKCIRLESIKAEEKTKQYEQRKEDSLYMRGIKLNEINCE